MKRFWLITFFLSAFSASAFGETIVYVPLTQSEIEESTAIHDLIEANVGEHKNFRVTAVPGEAAIILKSKAYKLGDSVVVTLERVENNKVRFVAQLKASEADELDLICRRLVNGALTLTQPSKDLNVHEVTQTEVNKGTNRTDVIRRWIIALGPDSEGNLNNNAGQLGVLIGYTWELDEPDVMLKLLYQGTSGYGTIGIGADYFFSESSTSFMAGGDVGYGAATVQGSPPPNILTTSSSGFAGNLEAGVAFFRSSKVNMEVLAHVGTVFSSNSYGQPVDYGLRLAILF